MVEEGTELRVVTQSDHAHFAAELLSLWRTDGLPQHPRRAELLFAIREHDNGWREPDSAPRVDPERGRPYDFTSYPEEARLEIWRRGITRFATSHPYAAALIARHAEALHQPPAEEWARLLQELEPLLQSCLARAGLDRAEVHRDYRLLRLADRLSLAVCAGWHQPFDCAGVHVTLADQRLVLEPFPLAGATRFEIPCRWIPHRRYPSDREVARALASAKWSSFEIRVTPV